MENSNTDIWYSGDWKPVNSPVAPYNGVTISATANYSPVTSPPVSRSLVSVDVVVTDYTCNAAGVSSPVSLYKSGITYYIPIPVDDTVSPPHPNEQFTVSGVEGIGFGQLSLDSNSGGLYLNIQFSYGMGLNKREELGYIMKFELTYTEGVQIIRVEG